MNFTEFYPWSSLVPFCYIYDPRTGLQYPVATVVSMSNAFAESNVVFAYEHVNEPIVEQAMSREVSEGTSDIGQQETPQNPQLEQARRSQPHGKVQTAVLNASRKNRRKLNRNCLTNVGCQMFVFASMRRRCEGVLRHLFPGLSEDQLLGYFAFAKRIKRSMFNYVTPDKLTSVLQVPHSEDEHNYRILRVLCHYYAREELVAAVLTSRKLKIASKLMHLRSRRQLLSFFNKIRR